MRKGRPRGRPYLCRFSDSAYAVDSLIRAHSRMAAIFLHPLPACLLERHGLEVTFSLRPFQSEAGLAGMGGNLIFAVPDSGCFKVLGNRQGDPPSAVQRLQ